MINQSILVVDDEAKMRRLLEIMLTQLGYSVHQAADGQEALDFLSSHVVDLVITDLRMPKIGGIELLRQLQEQGNEVSVIVVTAYGTVETAVEATRLGAKDFIEKPLSLAKLLHTVQNVLSESSQQIPAETQHTTVAPVPPVGKSVQLQLLREHLERLAQHDSTVLFQGEPGCGKTFSAKYLHAKSLRKKGRPRA